MEGALGGGEGGRHCVLLLIWWSCRDRKEVRDYIVAVW